MKKFFSYFLSICMILSIVSAASFSASAADAEFDKWDGTTTDTAWFNQDQDYFELDTAAKLAGLAYLANEYQGADTRTPVHSSARPSLSPRTSTSAVISGLPSESATTTPSQVCLSADLTV